MGLVEEVIPPLFKHQKKALERALELNSSVALLMEPGTGKSRVVIEFCKIKAREEGLRRVLIVSPLGVLSTWEDEIDKWLDIPHTTVRLDGSIEERKAKLKELKNNIGLTFVLVNYDVIARLKDFVRKWGPQCIVADEMHYIKHHTSQRSKAMHNLGLYARWKFGLTGTPITNSPMDIFSQYKFLDPSIFGTRWNDFKYTYGVWGGFNGFKLLKYKNLDDLQRKIHKIAFQCGKEELDLPDRTDQVIRVYPSPRTLKIYRQMADEFIAEIEEMGTKATASIILTKLLRLSQITGGFVKDENGMEIPIGREKLDVLKDLLTSYVVEGRQKVVIFARFRWEILQIRQLCKELGIRSVVFGKKGGDEAKKKFKEDPNVMVFISQISSGGVGINELVVSHIGIFYSIDYSSDHLIQAKDRLHRPGQKENVLYLYLLMDKTLDHKIYQRLRKHQSLATTIVKEYKEVV